LNFSALQRRNQALWNTKNKSTGAAGGAETHLTAKRLIYQKILL
jgi:hypothetical protein